MFFVVASYLLTIPLTVSFLYLTLTPRSSIIYSLAHKNFIWAPLSIFLLPFIFGGVICIPTHCKFLEDPAVPEQPCYFHNSQHSAYYVMGIWNI